MPNLSAAFADAQRWQPEPATDAELVIPTAAIELAVALLKEIAEDPFIRGRQRVAARRYLKRLGIAAEADDGRGPNRAD